MKTTPRSFRSAAGFSTHEILTAVTVGLLVTAGFVSFNHFQIRALHDQVTQIELQETDRSVLDLFTREVRRAGTNPTCANGITALSDLTETQIRIQADLDGNGVLAAANEDVTYRYDEETNSFQRITGGVTETLVTGVVFDRESSLSYYDASGTRLIPDPTLTSAQAASVRRVRLALALSDSGYNTSDGAPLQVAAATDINLRNRFFMGTVNCTP